METLLRFDNNLADPPGWVEANFMDHDFFKNKLLDVELERNETDWEWLKLMKDFTCCWAKRNSMYTGVRAGGNSAWYDSTKVDIETDRNLITICKEI